jgi:aryl-alcohol dehydrogenase-like predicted oxidoreductase
MADQSSAALSRRDALFGALLACFGAGFAGRSQSADSSAAAALITKTIPSSGEKIPAVGLGTDSFRSSESEAIREEIKRMVELGGSVIDTAAAYGDSEALIGDALAALGLRDRVFLATKLTAEGFFSSGGGGEASFHRSLERLKTQHIDLLQVHNLYGVDSLMPQLLQWKKAGKIRYLGVTTSSRSQHAEIVAAMYKYPLDFIQVDYSIADRDAAASLLPVALERRVAVLTNLPFARSALLGQARQRKLPDWAAQIDVSSWGQFFLKYVISHPAVTCTIPGSTKVAHLEDNQAAARGRWPDAAMRSRMEQYWDTMS